MPRLNLITPPWQAQDAIDSGDASESLIDGVFTDRGALTARPGLFLFKQITTTSDSCRGVFWWKAKNLFLIAYGTKLYASACTDAALTFTHVNAAAALGSETCIFAANRYWVYIASGGKIVRWDGDLAGAAEYDSSAAAIGLTEVTHVAYIDSYIVANKVDSQSWYYAGPTVPDTDPLVWSASGLAAEGSPDNIKVIASAWREVLILGLDSAEIWYDTGDTVTPFQRMEGAFIEQGTLSPYTLVEADNTWIWLTQKKEVVRMQGRTPAVISLAIREELENIQIVSDAVGFMLREYYVLTFPSAGLTWVYDLVKQTWGRWGEWLPDLYIYSIYRGKFSAWADLFGLYFVGGENGALYLADRSLRTDAGTLIRTEFISKPVDHGTFEYKWCQELIIKFKRGGTYKHESFGRFVALVAAGVEIPLNEEFYFQWEPMKILGSSSWTWAWSPLPTGLTFDAAARELTGTATSSAPVSSVLTITNSVSGLVVQLPITLTPGATLPAATEDRVIELFFQDEGQNWSTAIELDAGERGERYNIQKLAPMGRYAIRKYKLVFPAAIDVSFADMSETIEGAEA